jgi:predicted RNA-binding Zn-ribbon protein involved in translation (DUF1610 family)
MATKTKPTSFWCNGCHRWTTVAGDPPTSERSFWCRDCGEEYVCDECGWEINRFGECQRPADMGPCPDSVATS